MVGVGGRFVVIRPPFFGGYMIRILIAFLFVASAFGQRSPDIWTNVSQTIRPVRLPATNLEIANITLSRNASVSSNVNAGTLNATNDIQLNGVSIIGAISSSPLTNINQIIQPASAATNVSVPAMIVTNGIVYTSTNRTNLFLDYNHGTSINYLTAREEVPLIGRIALGTISDPVTNMGPVIKISKTEHTDSAMALNRNSVGEIVPILVGVRNTTNSNVQVTGGMFSATSYSEMTDNSTNNPDAGGLMSFGRVTGNGVGRGIGFYGEGETESPVGKVTGIEGRALNSSGSDISITNTSIPRSMGFWASSAGDQNAAAYGIGGTADPSWDVGLYAVDTGNKVINSALIREITTSTNGIELLGTHDIGIKVGANAGPVIIGASSHAIASTKLEVVNNSASSDPIAIFGANLGLANYSMHVRNGSGIMTFGIVQTPGAFIVGTETGDGIIRPSTGNYLNIGGTTNVIRIANTNTLGFFNVPILVFQQDQTTDLKQALTNYGLISAVPGATPLDLTGGALSAGTVDTGQGANELFDMNQNVLTTSDVIFNSVAITQGTANSTALTGTGYSVTGSGATTGYQLTGTLNTSGNPSFFQLKATNTSAGATTKMLEILGGAAGATALANIDISGILTLNGSVIIGATSGFIYGTRGRSTATADGDFEFRNNAATTTNTSLTFGLKKNPITASTLASAATIAPLDPVTFVSGSTTIDTITPPPDFSATGGQITIIPSAASTWATSTAGNIALATTAVVSKALILTWNAGTSKWYPSY